MDERILAVTAYPASGANCGSPHVTARWIPSSCGRLFNRSIALERVQMSNCSQLQ